MPVSACDIVTVSESRGRRTRPSAAAYWDRAMATGRTTPAVQRHYRKDSARPVRIHLTTPFRQRSV